MPYKLHKEGVITGSMNCFCLACDSFLTSQHEADEHVATTLHIKNLAAVSNSDKFKDDDIRKVGNDKSDIGVPVKCARGYYCEFCNLLLPIASKMTLHLAEDAHKHNKGTLLLRPVGRDVIAPNNILIEERAWHGLIDGVCSLCNAEYDDENDHKNCPKHSLNLVMKPIKFGEGNAIYRHLDESADQCLTCNKLLAPSKMADHFDDSEHHEVLAKRRIESNGVTDKKETIITNGVAEAETKETSTNKNNNKIDQAKKDSKKVSADQKAKVLESLSKYQSKGININLESETAFCKKCSNVVTFDVTEIENHIQTHTSAKTVDSDLLYPSNLDQNLNRVDINDKTTKTSDDATEEVKVLPDVDSKKKSDVASTSDEEDPDTTGPSKGTKKTNEKCTQGDDAKVFAEDNHLTYNGDNNQSYCRVCDVKLPSSLKSMKEHVAGATHTKLAASTQLSKTEKEPERSLTKEITREFLETAYDVEDFFYHDTVVNEEFCVRYTSFHLISNNNARARCIICEVNLPPFSDVDDHVKSRQHFSKHTRVPVITSEKSEFIREVRPGLFHCGYCNLVVSGWNDMKQHLKCSDHREQRSAGEYRLERHRPGLERYKMQKAIEAIGMMRFFNRF